jgi:hypothetical protein
VVDLLELEADGVDAEPMRVLLRENRGHLLDRGTSTRRRAEKS